MSSEGALDRFLDAYRTLRALTIAGEEPQFEAAYLTAAGLTEAIGDDASKLVCATQWFHLRRYRDAVMTLASASLDGPVSVYIQAARGFAWNQLQEPGKAIECYSWIIDHEGAPADEIAKALLNRGAAYGAQENLDAEIAEYDRLIELADAPQEQIANALVNRAIAYEEQGQFELAVADLHRALETPGGHHGKANWALGIAYEKTDKEAALNALRLAEAAFLSEEEVWLAQLVKAKIESLIQPHVGRIVELKGFAGAQPNDPPLDRPEQHILDRFAQSNWQDMYARYFSKAAHRKDGADNEFLVLRDWSSTAPVLPPENPSAEVRGGGYALRWDGAMMVVDPGHHFVQNFFEAHLNPLQIRSVLVTHNHGDHNQDLKSLDDLLYELSRRSPCRSQGPGLRTAEEQELCDKARTLGGVAAGKGYALLWDIDTSRRLVLEGENRPLRAQLIALHEAKEVSPANILSLITTRGPMGFHRAITLDCERLDQGLDCVIRVREPDETPFNVQYFRVRHTADVPNAVGIRVECRGNADPSGMHVGFTADTEYFSDLANNSHLGGAKLLIVHVSQPAPEEYLDKTRRPCKVGHLGLWGAMQIIRDVQPEMAIIGEFWPGLGDLRIPLTQMIRREVHKNLPKCVVLPGSRSLRVRLPSLEVICTHCGVPAAAGEVVAAAPQVPYGKLGYFCGSCQSPAHN